MERGVAVEESAVEKGRHHRRRTSKNAGQGSVGEDYRR